MNILQRSQASSPALTLAIGMAVLGAAGAAHADAPREGATHAAMHVTKSATCGCCGAWVALARDAGFEVTVTDVADVTLAKRDNDVPEALWSCHTARIEGYVVEGHVPFEAVERLLRDRPAIAGIAVPGMPMGSPGMGNDPRARYDVMAFGGEARDGAVFLAVGQ